MEGYFIEVNNMVDPSRVYCKKCGAVAEKKSGLWFATTFQNKELESINGNDRHISKNNLCGDCIQTVLIEAIAKGEQR